MTLSGPQGMQFLNGWKTVLGLAIALAACLVSHGVSLDAIVQCAKDVLTARTVEGVGLGVAALGIAHKIEKARAKS